MDDDEISTMGESEAKAFYRRHHFKIPLDDIRQVVRIATWRASLSFDASKGVALGCWTRLKIRGALRDYYRKEWMPSRTNEVKMTTLDNPRVLRMRSNEGVNEAAIVWQLTFDYLFSRLSPRMGSSVKGFYVGDLSVKDLAERMGTTESNITEALYVGRRKLKKMLKKR